MAATEGMADQVELSRLMRAESAWQAVVAVRPTPAGLAERVATEEPALAVMAELVAPAGRGRLRTALAVARGVTGARAAPAATERVVDRAKVGMVGMGAVPARAVLMGGVAPASRDSVDWEGRAVLEEVPDRDRMAQMGRTVCPCQPIVHPFQWTAFFALTVPLGDEQLLPTILVRPETSVLPQD